jgi:hypothetical protein
MNANNRVTPQQAALVLGVPVVRGLVEELSRFAGDDKTPWAKPGSTHNWHLLSADNSTPTHLPKLGDELLADGLLDRVNPVTGAAGQDDAFALIHLLKPSIAWTPSLCSLP